MGGPVAGPLALKRAHPIQAGGGMQLLLDPHARTENAPSAADSCGLVRPRPWGGTVSFVPDLPVILAFAVATIVLAITPGPDMALQLSRAINYGRAHGLAALAGAMSGIMVHTALVAFGISVLIIAAPTAFLVLKIAGAVYLLWLAYQAIVHGGGLRLADKAGKAPRVVDSYAAGLGINLLNPKVVLFFVTFLPQFVESHDPAATGKLFFLGAEFVLLSIPLGIVTVFAAAWLAAAFKRSKWVERVLNWSFAGIFTAFAVTILTAQARH
jgi:threonine/homoserine/homoserine lactone efflux protein